MKELSPTLSIIGAGPAGLTAAIYASRGGIPVTVYEKLNCGGQVSTTPDVDNYPGFPGISGFELSQNMESHAVGLGAALEREAVTGLDLTPGGLAVITASGRRETGALILAMGARRRTLGVKGEEALFGRGVSYCATCDGNFFRGADVAVVGGGNTALEDALYLSKICSTVNLIHRRNAFRGDRLLENLTRQADNIQLWLERVPTMISGASRVEAITLRHVLTGLEESLAVSAVFVAVGTVAESELLGGALPLDGQVRVVTGDDCATLIPGVYAAGDLRAKSLYQIVTAASDGAVAATQALRFLEGA